MRAKRNRQEYRGKLSENVINPVIALPQLVPPAVCVMELPARPKL